MNVKKKSEKEKNLEKSGKKRQHFPNVRSLMKHSHAYNHTQRNPLTIQINYLNVSFFSRFISPERLSFSLAHIFFDVTLFHFLFIIPVLFFDQFVVTIVTLLSSLKIHSISI